MPDLEEAQEEKKAIKKGEIPDGHDHSFPGWRIQDWMSIGTDEVHKWTTTVKAGQFRLALSVGQRGKEQRESFRVKFIPPAGSGLEPEVQKGPNASRTWMKPPPGVYTIRIVNLSPPDYQARYKIVAHA